MTKYIETTGKTEELAVAAALEQLGLDRDDVSVEVLARAKTGFLGIGSSPAKVRVSYEAPDEAVFVPVPDRTADIEQFLIGLMEHLEVEAKPVITVNAEGTYEVVLEGEDLGALIGRRGETLDAIQQLTNYAVNHGQRSRARIHVDCENYRAKREESLQRLARKTAGKAVKYRRNMMLEPMNAYERHVIHAELQEYHPNISTYSTGTEPNRRIVVAYNK